MKKYNQNLNSIPTHKESCCNGLEKLSTLGLVLLIIHSNVVAWNEMRWNDRFWVSIMFVSRRYTVIIHQFDFPCVLKRESRNHCAGFQNLHFQYTFQGINIQCGKNMYVHVAAQWSTASSFRALKQLKRKADCWSKS